jgi:hypothetical protein
MSDIEKYLIEMRDKLDTENPEPGHFKRFNKRLGKDARPARRLNFRHVLQIAASIAIILASGIVIVKSSKGSDKVAQNSVIEEFQATSSYYVHQVNNRIEDIQSYPFDNGTEKDILLTELTEMDTYYSELLVELDANPGDERVMNTLIQHYQIKIQVMDQILGQLIQLKNDKTQNNEKASI